MTERQGCSGDGISIRIPTADPYPWRFSWGSRYPRQSPGLPRGRNFYPHIYLPHTHTHGDPHGDSHTHGRPAERSPCRFTRRNTPEYRDVSRSAARRRGHRVLPVRAAAARRLAASADISCRRADRPTWRGARSGATGNRRFVGRRDVTRPRDIRDESASFAKRPPASGRALSTHARVVSCATWMYNARRRPVASSTGNDVTPRQVRWITSSCREDVKSRRSR